MFFNISTFNKNVELVEMSKLGVGVTKLYQNETPRPTNNLNGSLSQIKAQNKTIQILLTIIFLTHVFLAHPII